MELLSPLCGSQGELVKSCRNQGMISDVTLVFLAVKTELDLGLWLSSSRYLFFIGFVSILYFFVMYIMFLRYII